jgi:tight adherence protein C
MVNFLATNLLARAAFLALVFALVLLVVMVSARVAGRRANLKAEIRSIAHTGPTSGRMRLQERKDTGWARLAERIESAGLNLTDTQGDKLRAKLVAAGYTSPTAPKIFTLARLVFVLLLPAVYLVLVSSSSSEPLSFMKLYVVGSVLALVGLYLPNLFVTARADRRRETVTNGFPDCLDLILVCVEAGLGLEAAMDRVGREMVNSHPLVAALLSTATLQAARRRAARGGAAQDGREQRGRRGRSFATCCIQSDKLGTSIADTLRVYAAEMREKRRLRAEEKAHRLPVLISIPLVVCMLPTMIGVLMMPGAIRVVRQLLPALSGGG